MSKEFLSQDEVDALLRGVSGEAEEEEAPAEDTSSVRPYDLATQERIVRGRMPTLETINERFAKLLRVALSRFVRRTAEIVVRPVRVQKYSDFTRNLVTPTNLNLVQVRPLRGTALFVLDPNLVSVVIDSLFGGSGQIQIYVEGRDFTATEMRIVQRLLATAFEEYEKSWKPVHEVKFEYLRSEMNTQFANIATPNEVVVVATFDIEFGGTGGAFHICMPYAMLEPIRDQLYGSMQGDHIEADKRWVKMLTRQVQNAEVELTVKLGRAQVTLGQILNMQAGDVIALDLPDPVVAEVDGIPVLACKCGVSNNRYALRVEHMINNAVME